MNRLTTCLQALFLLLILWAQQVGGQPAYRFVRDIDAALQTSSTPFRFQEAAGEYALIGEMDSALAVFDRPASVALSGSQIPAAGSSLDSFQPQNAASWIAERARFHRVLVINERHVRPQTRAFLTALLPRLRETGYRYLLAEAVAEPDSVLQRRGYPSLSTGYYTREAAFARLLRTALALGMRVSGYDASAPGDWQLREKAQAQRISEIIAGDPEARFIVFCGLDHAREELPYMAGVLREQTGIDPLTVDMVTMDQRSDPRLESPFGQYRDSLTALLFTTPAGKAFHTGSKQFDAQVFLPVGKKIQGRPDWRIAPGDRLLNVTQKIRIGFPVRLSVYRASEPEGDAVPLDVLELADATDPSAVIVPAAGNYRILAENAHGERQVVFPEGRKK